MTDQSSAAAVARPESCKANLDTEYPTCDRCGLAWHVGDPAPPCKPMNFEALHKVLLGEVFALEGSHRAIVQMMRDDVAPADPVAPLKRAAALRFVLLLIDRCAGSKAIVGELGRIARARDAADKDPRSVRIVNLDRDHND